MLLFIIFVLVFALFLVVAYKLGSDVFEKSGVWIVVACIIAIGAVVFYINSCWIYIIYGVCIYLFAMAIDGIVTSGVEGRRFLKIASYLFATLLLFVPAYAVLEVCKEQEKTEPVLIEDVRVVGDKISINHGQFMFDIDDDLLIRTGDSLRLVSKGDSIKYYDGSLGDDMLIFITPDGENHEKF